MPEPLFPEFPFLESAADQMPRLLLEPTMARGGLFDGAWWPHSHDVRAELPDLITRWARIWAAWSGSRWTPPPGTRFRVR
jgi:hypothetical protein